jgi:hypothetical protein
VPSLFPKVIVVLIVAPFWMRRNASRLNGNGLTSPTGRFMMNPVQLNPIDPDGNADDILSL